MKKMLIVLGLLLPLLMAAAGDEMATTDSGARVVLHEDGTWEAAPEKPDEQAEPPTPPASEWTIQIKNDPMTDQKRYVAIMTADPDKSTGNGQAFAVRCINGKLELILITSSLVEDSYVEIRLDSRKTQKSNMKRVSTHKGYWLNSPHKGIKQLIEEKVKKVTFRYKTYRGTNEIAVFNIEGLQEALKGFPCKY